MNRGSGRVAFPAMFQLGEDSHIAERLGLPPGVANGNRVPGGPDGRSRAVDGRHPDGCPNVVRKVAQAIRVGARQEPNTQRQRVPPAPVLYVDQTLGRGPLPVGDGCGGGRALAAIRQHGHHLRVAGQCIPNDRWSGPADQRHETCAGLPDEVVSVCTPAPGAVSQHGARLQKPGLVGQLAHDVLAAEAQGSSGRIRSQTRYHRELAALQPCRAKKTTPGISRRR